MAEYEYNPDGTVKNLYCGNLHTQYAYDADRNMTGLKTLLGSEVLMDNHYRYDGNGNRTEKRQKQGTTIVTARLLDGYRETMKKSECNQKEYLEDGDFIIYKLYEIDI